MADLDTPSAARKPHAQECRQLTAEEMESIGANPGLSRTLRTHLGGLWTQNKDDRNLYQTTLSQSEGRPIIAYLNEIGVPYCASTSRAQTEIVVDGPAFQQTMFNISANGDQPGITPTSRSR